MLRMALHEKCPNMEIFLVRIFLYSVQIQESTNQKTLPIRTLFTQCDTLQTIKIITSSPNIKFFKYNENQLEDFAHFAFSVEV